MKRILKYMLVLICMMLPWQGDVQAGLFSKYSNYIYYHCADWGPNEDGTDELIYFVKQIIFEENDNNRYGNVVYFCSMKPDGSEKKEIVKLFEDTKYYLDINGNTSFMDINYKTKKAAIAFSAGAKECTGLWTINLDGTGFKKIKEHEWLEGNIRTRINHPSWSPDGDYIIFEETQRRSLSEYYIVKIDNKGENKVYLTSEKDGGIYNKQPAVSPDGKTIAYSYFWWKPKPGEKKGGRNLWLMDSDGKNKRMLYDNNFHYADYPEWSPDGKLIHIINPSFTILDAATGKMVREKKTFSTGKVHWNDKYGFIIDGRGSVSIYNEETVVDIALTEFVTTGKKRDISKNKYKWGGSKK